MIHRSGTSQSRKTPYGFSDRRVHYGWTSTNAVVTTFQQIGQSITNVRVSK